MGASYIEQLVIPSPPPQEFINDIEGQQSVNDQQNKFNRSMTSFMDDLYNILHNGYLVRSLRIEEITADKITAGIIAASGILVGSSRFELDGASGQLRIKDTQGTPVTVVAIGDFAGGTDYGIQIRNAADTVVFQALSNAGTFINGAVISSATIGGGSLANGAVNTTQLADNAVTTVKILNAAITGAKIAGSTITGSNISASTITGSHLADVTITGAKIINSTITDSKINDVNGSKLATGSVTNAKIDSLSASKITLTGTLTCNASSGTAINVTGAAAIAFTSGGDMQFTAGASDKNFINFRNSAGTTKGQISYSPSSDRFIVKGINSADLRLESTAVVQILGSANVIGASSSDTCAFNARVASDIDPSSNNSRDLGSSSLKWANMWTVVDNVGDIHFDNGFVLTEPDKVYKDQAPDEGLYLMSSEWQPIAFFTNNGDMLIPGSVMELTEFSEPDFKKGEVNEEPKAH